MLDQSDPSSWSLLDLISCSWLPVGRTVVQHSPAPPSDRLSPLSCRSWSLVTVPPAPGSQFGPGVGPRGPGLLLAGPGS